MNAVPFNPTPSRALVTSAPKVLVVDDDRLITEVVAGLLPHMGFAADRAVGGEEGLKMALENSYCAVITDVQMPDIDGFELAKRLRESVHPCPTLIALTAYTTAKAVVERSDVFDAVPEGGDAYLLRHVIHEWDEPRATAILRNCRRAIRSGASAPTSRCRGAMPAARSTWRRAWRPTSHRPR